MLENLAEVSTGDVTHAAVVRRRFVQWHPDAELLVFGAGIVAVRFAGSRMVRANPWYSLLHPVASMVMVWILGTCVWRIWLDRPSLWRGDSHR